MQSELSKRVLSAVAMAAVALAAVWAGLWPFLVLLCPLASVAAWEWSGLTAGDGRPIVAVVHASLLCLVAVVAGAGELLWAMLGLVTGATAAALWQPRSKLGLGILYLGLPLLALVVLRSDETYGFHAVLFVLLVVWSADTAAYFAGRAIGGPKLAPSISPGKTWSGAIGGVVVPVVIAVFYASFLGNTSATALAVLGAGLAVMSQIGDLSESALKRAAGIKDSSNLIPGHGGLLDRLDGIIFAAVAAGVLAGVRDHRNPGEALLLWP